MPSSINTERDKKNTRVWTGLRHCRCSRNHPKSVATIVLSINTDSGFEVAWLSSITPARKKVGYAQGSHDAHSRFRQCPICPKARPVLPAGFCCGVVLRCRAWLFPSSFEKTLAGRCEAKSDKQSARDAATLANKLCQTYPILCSLHAHAGVAHSSSVRS